MKPTPQSLQSLQKEYEILCLLDYDPDRLEVVTREIKKRGAVPGGV
ncbi:MAG TPA: hypothetical protein PKI66_06390 [Methanobacteriaceae archaeon]|nr:hypothetical protein [Methanobacteriaceae archaeon]